MKRILCLVLGFLMIFSALVFAQDAECYMCGDYAGEDCVIDEDGYIYCYECAEEYLYYYEDEEYFDVVCDYCDECFEESEIWYYEGNGLCPYCDEILPGYEKEALTVFIWYEYDYATKEYLVYMEASEYGAEIYYTVNTNTPNKHSKKYDEPFYVIGKDPVVRAIAYLGEEKSEIINVWLDPEDSVEYSDECPYCMERYTYDTIEYDEDGYGLCPSCYEVVEEPEDEYYEEYYEDDEWYEDEEYCEEEEYYEETKQVVIKLTIGSNVAYINDQYIWIDSAPVIRNDRTMLPIRVVAEALGATVEWDDDTKTVSVETAGGGHTFLITIGNPNIWVWNYPGGYDFDPRKGSLPPLDSVAFIENGRTYLPVRFVAEALGAEVSWDNSTRTVTIVKNLK